MCLLIRWHLLLAGKTDAAVKKPVLKMYITNNNKKKPV